VKIEVWESRQRAKIESEMRRIEVHSHAFPCINKSFLPFFLIQYVSGAAFFGSKQIF
jgi:hypothetical protein